MTARRLQEVLVPVHRYRVQHLDGIGVSGIIYILLEGDFSLRILVQTMIGGMDSDTPVALPVNGVMMGLYCARKPAYHTPGSVGKGADQIYTLSSPGGML